MQLNRVLAVTLAFVGAGAALAHPGTPGHIHPEMSLAQQALHAALNWAPVAGLFVIAAWGAHSARRSQG